MSIFCFRATAGVAAVRVGAVEEGGSASGVSWVGVDAPPEDRTASPAATIVVSAARIPRAILTFPSRILGSSHVGAWIGTHSARFRPGAQLPDVERTFDYGNLRRHPAGERHVVRHLGEHDADGSADLDVEDLVDGAVRRGHEVADQPERRVLVE